MTTRGTAEAGSALAAGVGIRITCEPSGKGEDRVAVLVFAGDEVGPAQAIGRGWPAGGDPPGPSRGPEAATMCVELRYGGGVVSQTEITGRASVARFGLMHAGGHLDASAFSLRPVPAPGDACGPPAARAAIALRMRPETKMERLAERLFPVPEGKPTPFPCAAELLALAQALSG